MNALTGKFARVLYSVPFLMFGLFHFFSADKMSAMVPGFIPGGAFWAYFTGLCLIAAAVAIMFNWMAKTASFCLALLLLVFILTIHIPATMDAKMFAMAMSSLLKDIALMGGALIIAGSSTDQRPGDR